MNAIHTEMLYLQRRLAATRAMAKAAKGPCARKAHEALAQLYRERLAMLSAKAARLAAEPVPTFAVRGLRTAPPMLRLAKHRALLTLELAS